LYGRIPKDVKIDEVIRNGAKGCSGSVELESGHIITRSRKPNTLVITNPDGTELQGKDAKETQSLIVNLIGLDFEAFCQTIYFSQSNPKKFISASDTDKALILSEIQDLTIFDRARKNVQALIKTEESNLQLLKTEKVKSDAALERLQSNSRIITNFLKNWETDKAQKIADIKDEILANCSKIAAKEQLLSNTSTTHDLLAESERIEGMREHLQLKRSQYQELIVRAEYEKKAKAKRQTDIAKLSKNVESLAITVAKFESADNLCPTCGAAVADHKIHEVFKERSRYQTELLDAKKQLEELTGQTEEANSVDDSDKTKTLLNDIDLELKDLKSQEDKIKKLGNERVLLERELADLEKSLAKTNQELTRVESSKPEKGYNDLDALAVEIETIKAEGLEIANAVKETQNLIGSYETLKTGFKEVKQYVFQALLHELSTKATKFACDLFEVPIAIKFSNEGDDGALNKINSVIKLNGLERSIGLLSGGQFKRVEIATDLALASIIGGRSQKPINFRVLDEPFKDLSESSMGKVVELLQGLNGVTVLIEHNSIVKSIIHNTFNIDYRNGISRVSNAS
jgi:DNA repair exonuclease SbcCD ATPase subunit